MPAKLQWYLYVFTCPASEDFWVFAGGQFHRFAYLPGAFRFIRAQAALPAFAQGGCGIFTPAERQMLSAEAARCGLGLRFYDDERTCLEQTLHQRLPQHVYGAQPPAGSFPTGPAWSRQRPE